MRVHRHVTISEYDDIHIVVKSLFTPKVISITQMLNTLIESWHINSDPDSLFHLFFTDYERKYNL